jgi:hypothetical protein
MYWIREIAGWLLIVVALLLIRTAATFVTDIDSPRIVEAGVVVFAAVSVLKAGTLLIRISTAARLCHSNPPSDKVGV